MQWHEMDWPIWVDSLNLLEVTAVPITLLIDETGVIRAVNPSKDRYREFLETPRPSQDAYPTLVAYPKRPTYSQPAADDSRPEVWSDFAINTFLWGEPSELTQAIHAFGKAKTLAPKDGSIAFRLGATHRKRFDSDYREATDFTLAIENWAAALELDPNQYIWRRRIQQYGPRLDKPYPFYDWVEEARTAIVARGSTPHPLVVEPGGAEIAAPAKQLTSEGTGDIVEPDPQGRILRDETYVTLDATVVGDTSQPGQAIRVHLLWTPNERLKAHWNNEAENMSIWLESPDGWQTPAQSLTFMNPPQIVESTPRAFDFELRRVDSDSQSEVLKGYALYYVCEDINGVCLYRRQDFEVSLRP